MKLCKSEQCLGCFACANICPHGAIEMEEDAIGALQPVINTKKCIECGACSKACPVLHPVGTNSVMDCYAVWSKDENVVRNSASAGLVTTLSKIIINDGGVVFGTRYDNNCLIFDYAEDIDKLGEFQGSKYIHAHVRDSYRKIKEFLRQNRKVLFVGTPCQTAGLKSFLRKDYEKLITIDLICHGVPPQKYLTEYMQGIMGKKPYDKILFRGPEGEKTVAYNKGKTVYRKDKARDLFYSAYAKSYINRENCYTCPFTSLSRVGDITAGDFWGLNKKDLKEDAANIPYVSLAFVNTKKGHDLLKEAEKELYCEKREITETLQGNKQLQTPCVKPKDRNVFLKKYANKGFVKALKGTVVYKQVKKTNLYFAIINPLIKISKIFKSIIK